jgi:ENTH domain
LTVLEYLLINGHDDIVFEFREDIFYLNLLKEYQFTEFGEDKGKIIREKVIKIISMLENEKLLESQREEVSKLKSRSGK